MRYRENFFYLFFLYHFCRPCLVEMKQVVHRLTPSHRRILQELSQYDFLITARDDMATHEPVHTQKVLRSILCNATKAN